MNNSSNVLYNTPRPNSRLPQFPAGCGQQAGGTRPGRREVRNVSPWDLTRVTAAPGSGSLMPWGFRILPSLLSPPSLDLGSQVSSTAASSSLIHAPPITGPQVCPHDLFHSQTFLLWFCVINFLKINYFTITNGRGIVFACFCQKKKKKRKKHP